VLLEDHTSVLTILTLAAVPAAAAQVVSVILALNQVSSAANPLPLQTPGLCWPLVPQLPAALFLN